MVYTVYQELDNGGHWRLTHASYEALSTAGWEVPPVASDSPGGLPRQARLHGHTLHEAIASWEAVTGRDSAEKSCSCATCPPAHRFTEHS